MVNFFPSYYFCLFFCILAQILSFNSGIEAKTQYPLNSEFYVDANAIINCDNLDNQIDNFVSTSHF